MWNDIGNRREDESEEPKVATVELSGDTRDGGQGMATTRTSGKGDSDGEAVRRRTYTKRTLNYESETNIRCQSMRA